MVIPFEPGGDTGYHRGLKMMGRDAMGDIFDYISFFLASVFLAVLKLTGFIDWDWWVTTLPADFGLSIWMVTMLAR
jgi:hypothetical protein